MKKILLLGAILLAGVSASAQKALVKEAKNAAKGNAPLEKVIEIITPAFSDPETAQDPETYTTIGNLAFERFDSNLIKQQLKQLPEGGDILMADELLTGYKMYQKALPLDSLPNAKGQIKPKHSGKIINNIGGHYRDFLNAGYSLYQAERYSDAADAWDVYVGLTYDPRYAKAITKEALSPDSIIGEILYNSAVASFFAKDLPRSIKYFYAAQDKGYNKKVLYDYAISVAKTLNDNEAVMHFAKTAIPIYGKQDGNYMALIIDQMLNEKKFDEALAMIDSALADDPNNSQYYVIRGVLYEQQGKPSEEVKGEFLKAANIGPDNSQAQYYYGRALCEEAYKINDAAPINNEAEYQRIYNGEILPRFNEAVQYLEKAYELDNNNYNALRYLKNVYYNLHNTAKEKEIDILLGGQ